mmetsp:Transcript_11447/g.29580  ORF Transcript_11447/g.29580 Transcript_11447/m.29580 type:complete len:447 (+) Transcript_11447:53-1393(+)
MSDGKVVVVTGCTRGIGRSLFEWFAANGHRVAGCGSNAVLVEALQTSHPRSTVAAVDVREEASVAAWLRGVHEMFGHIDLLVCCAGILPAAGNLWEIKADSWAEGCEVNIQGLARVLRHSVPKLSTPGACAVLLSSRYGRSVTRGQGCYSATKWSTEAMAKTLALELRDKGIAVVSLDPGIVDTDMLKQSNPNGAACGEQDVKEFAADAGPFMLSLTMADTGRNLTASGSPASYFTTGVAYKDRPDWANGFGKFVRACDDTREDEGGSASAPKRPRVADAHALADAKVGIGDGKSLRYFISGVMLGSRRQLNDASVDLHPQDYRERMTQIILKTDPRAEVVDPLQVVKSRAASMDKTIEELSRETGLVRQAFEEVVDLAARCDVVVSNLPEASMGSAIEIWEARNAGKLVLTISPLQDNWLLRSVTHHNFVDLDDFERNLHIHLPK